MAVATDMAPVSAPRYSSPAAFAGAALLRSSTKDAGTPSPVSPAELQEMRSVTPVAPVTPPTSAAGAPRRSTAGAGFSGSRPGTGVSKASSLVSSGERTISNQTAQTLAAPGRPSDRSPVGDSRVRKASSKSNPTQVGLLGRLQPPSTQSPPATARSQASSRADVVRKSERLHSRELMGTDTKIGIASNGGGASSSTVTPRPLNSNSRVRTAPANSLVVATEGAPVQVGKARNVTSMKESQALPPRTRIPPPELDCDSREEDTRLCKEIFLLAAKTPSGVGCLAQFADPRRLEGVRFGDFKSVQHFLLASFRGKSATSPGEACDDPSRGLEREFRDLDENKDLCLDQQEFKIFVDGLLESFGRPGLRSALEKLQNHAKTLQSKYDIRLSSQLCLKVLSAQHLGPQHVDQVESLLERLADPNYTEGEGASTFSSAVAKSDVTVIERLLHWGGCPSRCTMGCDSAFLAAVRARQLDALQLCVHRSAASQPSEANAEAVDGALTASMSLVQNMPTLSDKDIRELVLTKAADINFKTSQGWTPLTASVFWGKKSSVETLIRFPSLNKKLTLHVDNPDAKKRTALHVAARKGQVDVVVMLEKARACINAQDMDGVTPLHCAIVNGRSDVIVALVGASADLSVKDRQGFTPYMVRDAPSNVASALSHSAKDALEPPEAVNFTRHIIPILKKGQVPTDKLQEVLDLPGVNGKVENLRLYDQVFELRRGPQSGRLGKLWELLCKDMLQRMWSGLVDEGEGESSATVKDGDAGTLTAIHADDSDADFLPVLEERGKTRVVGDSREIRRRRRMQRRFVESWLAESAGPPKSQDWNYEDNRECYRAELLACVQAEVSKYQAACDAACDAMRSRQGGDDLLNMPEEEVIAKDYLNQLAAHPILTWLESMDSVGAMKALRQVNAFGKLPEEGTDKEAIMRLMDMVTRESDFSTAPAFWQNVYKRWLTSYASIADVEFQAKIRRFVSEFNEDQASAENDLKVAYHARKPKTYSALKHEEMFQGECGWRSVTERTRAAALLNVIRCTLVAKNPASLCAVVDALRHARLANGAVERIELVRIRNLFHHSAQPRHGTRMVVLNVMFRTGERLGGAGGHMSIGMIGEVRLTLPDFQAAADRVRPLLRFLDGGYDPMPEGSSTT
eukprot:TRINITY_DN69608_c0_g1_i1.p1 TRINITY_DN69608_c0_g1~~TRINITY_DN69608_c0_g1_i1.p1  ORF type:complete len:1145 (+),score=180.32 TRINITY_DN69608_c0_g1_i1:37-3471(+)